MLAPNENTCILADENCTQTTYMVFYIPFLRACFGCFVITKEYRSNSIAQMYSYTVFLYDKSISTTGCVRKMFMVKGYFRVK